MYICIYSMYMSMLSVCLYLWTCLCVDLHAYIGRKQEKIVIVLAFINQYFRHTEVEGEKGISLPLN